MKRKQGRHSTFWHRHGLGLTALGILVLWIVLYSLWDPQTHWGSFFGNAVADWTGMVVMIYATKHLYEKGSSESKDPDPKLLREPLLWVYDHSLTLFLLVTGTGWIFLFARSAPDGKWGQVAGNIVSEWTQIVGLVLLTKHLIEWHSKESQNSDE
ncbi:hypothetical protein Acid345_1797 [Candidatus Koribacter versatilis Ellin345]|uniref:Uncharacterized protein n=1 Tax=Koribacter versatilis (strain Ellin345) TaxID=204669 RepID=Q1IQQ2_KORVE|nr:hypothetical protein [Candidatus Koribacter versatilis]ABF40798.1 hypothetical protein Acid345_1797 [Candidatus Koribacter versatilis Ellin345]